MIIEPFTQARFQIVAMIRMQHFSAAFLKMLQFSTCLNYWNSIKVASYHCNHNTRENADAICVLYIAEQIEFGRYVQPMCLPDDETVFSEGSRCFIAGWGETFSNDQESSLHELDMPLLRYFFVSLMLKNFFT